MSRTDWRRLRDIQIKVFNVKIKRSIQQLTKAASTGKTNQGMIQLLRLCIIDKDDTIPITLMKRDFYYLDLGFIDGVINASAAVPDWWQVRKEGKRPQLVIEFGQRGKRGGIGYANYTLHIPHYKHRTPPKTSPIPAYRKGQHEGILTLFDNSKVIVNAFSLSEAKQVIEAAKKVISPKYLKNSHVKYGTRKGVDLKEVQVYPAKAKFFPTGLENTVPKWIANFRK